MDHSKEDAPEIIERRMEDALRRALKTKPTPHKTKAAPQPKPKK
jgi:hypothetical protein